MKRVDVLMPSTSQYEVLHHFARKLYEAFVRSGISCRLLSGDERIYSTLNSPPDFTIGFNGALKMEDGSLFCDHIHVPHISWLVDPPFRFLELIESPNIVITCDDRACCEMLRKLSFERTVFMPHAVEQELCPDLNKEKIYDIVFLATFIDAKKRRKEWKKQFNSDVRILMEKAADAALNDDFTSYLTELETQLDPWKHQLAYEEVEMYIKGIDRLNLIRSFSDQEVHIFGGSVDSNGWKRQFKSQSNFIVHPPVSYEQALEIMKQSKVVLNSSIKNKLGAHERIFTAAACGAVVATNENPIMREYFKPEKEILLYNRQYFEIKERVQYLLKNEDLRAEVAKAGRERVMQAHTWDHRVKHLLQEIKPYLKQMRK